MISTYIIYQSILTLNLGCQYWIESWLCIITVDINNYCTNYSNNYLRNLIKNLNVKKITSIIRRNRNEYFCDKKVSTISGSDIGQVYQSSNQNVLKIKNNNSRYMGRYKSCFFFFCETVYTLFRNIYIYIICIMHSQALKCID